MSLQLSKFQPAKKHIIAATVVLLLIIWMASGNLRSAREEAPDFDEEGAEQVTRVEVKSIQATDYRPVLPLQGRLEPWRKTEVIARVSGEVVALPVEQGEIVAAGTVLVELDEEDRSARVAQLQADLELAQAELEGAQQLGEQDLVSRTERLRLTAEVARARAELAAADLALNFTRPSAPYNGVFDRRYIELGDYVQSGQELLRFAQIDRLRVMANVAQQEIGRVQREQEVAVSMLDGYQLTGQVRHVTRVADPQTRSFLIEVEITNDELRPIAGASANLEIQLDSVRAHQVPPSVLRLDGDGQTVIRVVDEQDEVAEVSVQVLSMGREYLWVTGLAETQRVIVQGAGFTEVGQSVDVRVREEW